jgi:hypothetical protein
MNILSLLKKFYADLSQKEVNGYCVGAIAFIMVLVLLTSCTPSTYIEPIEPTPPVVEANDLPDMLSDSWQTDTVYTVAVSCPDTVTFTWSAEFLPGPSIKICTEPTQGVFGTCAVYELEEQDGVLFWLHDGEYIVSQQVESNGHLVGYNLNSGCAVVIW